MGVQAGWPCPRTSVSRVSSTELLRLIRVCLTKRMNTGERLAEEPKRHAKRERLARTNASLPQNLGLIGAKEPLRRWQISLMVLSSVIERGRLG